MTDNSRYNICETKFKNPLAKVTLEEAGRLRNESLASSSSDATFSTTSTSQSSSATLIATSGAQSISTPTPTTSSIPTENNASISGGTIAGIVIGVLAVIAILIAGIFLMKRRRRNTAGERRGVVHEADASDQSPRPMLSEGSGWIADGKTYNGSPPAYHQHKVELPTTERRAELQ